MSSHRNTTRSETQQHGAQLATWASVPRVNKQNSLNERLARSINELRLVIADVANAVFRTRGRNGHQDRSTTILERR